MHPYRVIADVGPREVPRFVRPCEDVDLVPETEWDGAALAFDPGRPLWARMDLVVRELDAALRERDLGEDAGRLLLSVVGAVLLLVSFVLTAFMLAR